MKVLPTVEGLDRLHSKIDDNLQAFDRRLEEFAELFRQNCLMVERFDEVMTLKASKINVEEQFRELRKRNDRVVAQIHH